ncbi:succinate dehydrogenase subunit 5, mitochondrial isoform X2 [Selaginella moellendorffii]|uniref:succinate dehydrogenase subunit 5, mitochondrial isoform X2 n=1 Tax=Selaginella moellendorffii TaxID=88036 RepID=UPI000D1CF3AC|nr:succinate dehydrogenase subunit 5, mitochondrial isoform X2 [Selaginella moellendorffii]|eukprot:XP_024526634.1 succinate dehydrogenase subunit 5, mitochondrial isoform X2 [Selaginella moellendorffii]
MASSLSALRHWRAFASPSSRIFDRQGSSAASNLWRRGFATAGTIPECSDPAIKKALKQLYAINWYDIDEKTANIVEETLSTGEGTADHTILKDTWSSARAVETFYGTLDALRKSIDDLMGLSGENTGPLPDQHQRALEAVHSKYVKYLSSFGEHEHSLKKKVELELGSTLVLLKQRVSGLPPKWGDVGLLGTSGLSGSYIEQRE